MNYENRMGDIEILDVYTLGTPRTSLSFDEYTQLLWINLETKLEPFQRTSFQIEFHSVIPNGPYDRANSHGSNSSESRIYKFTSFYPMPCVYDKFDGWNTDPYLDSCDPFYHDMAYYNLTIEAPKEIKVVATGELVEKVIKGARTIYRFDPRFPVREVTFAASRYYQMQSTIINGVNISTYYIPKSGYVWENDAIDYAVNAFDLFNDTFGYYPYSSLNIVEEYADFYLGMEYPAQVYASERIDQYTVPTSQKKQILEKVIVHEVAHQWWYNLVGFDQIDWGFMDEGLTCWSTDYYAEIYHFDWEFFQGNNRYYDVVRTYFAETGESSKLNQSAYEIISNNLDFVHISYRKSPLIFEKIRRTIGDLNFINGLQTFFQQFQFKIALLSDLQQIFEDILDSPLDWLFFPWFDNPFLPRYNFLECSWNENQQILHLTVNDLNTPINDYHYSQQLELLIYDSDEILIYNEWIWINGTTNLDIPFINKPLKVKLEYGDEVIVQLSSANITYLERFIEISTSILGYDTTLMLILGLLSLIYVISKIRAKQSK